MTNENLEFHRFVTYMPDGSLDGCYLQIPQEDQIGRTIPFPESEVWRWASYRANGDRTGVELIPEDEMPGYEPPVDPEPEEPVQSGEQSAQP